MSQREQRAVVVGASVAGLLAARVLADASAEVVLLERDRLPDGPAHRRGAPQGRHTHVLLPRGRDALEELFPGLTAELVARGAPLARSSQARRFIEGGYYCRFESPLRTLLVSRPLLEARLRARVLARPNVRALEGVAVLGPVASGGGGKGRWPGCGWRAGATARAAGPRRRSAPRRRGARRRAAHGRHARCKRAGARGLIVWRCYETCARMCLDARRQR